MLVYEDQFKSPTISQIEVKKIYEKNISKTLGFWEYVLSEEGEIISEMFCEDGIIFIIRKREYPDEMQFR